MRQTATVYYCDRCDRKLNTFRNKLNIATDKGGFSLQIQVFRVSSTQNVPADLCQECAKQLLGDALNRVVEGERTTKGFEDVEEQGWED